MMSGFLGKKRWWLVLILLAATFLRVYRLDDVPLGLSGDEAAIGYNAYSILKTGRDEYGRFFPIIFRSFGDGKLPLPVYLTVPAVAVGGLSVLSVRMVAVMFGVVAVGLLFKVARKLFDDERVALASALLLAVSPWHVQLSRYNVPVALAFCLFLLFLLTKKDRLKFIIAILALLSHPSMWVLLTPLLLVSFWRNIKQLVGVVLVLSLMAVITWPGWSSFYFKDAFFREIGFINRVNQLQGYVLQGTHSSLLTKLTENKVVVLTDQIFKNYVRTFDFYSLFSFSDVPQPFFVSDFGKLYTFEFFAFALGVFWILKEGNKSGRLLFGLLFLAPIPAIFLIKHFAGEYSYIMIIPFYLLAAYGVVKMMKHRGAAGVFLVLVGLFATTFFHYYFKHYPLLSYKEWNYGYRLINEKIKPVVVNYDKVIISDALAVKPYIFTLFFQKIDPGWYQQSVKDGGGSAFGKYQFQAIVPERESGLKNVLLVDYDDGKGGYCESHTVFCANQVDEIVLPDKVSSFRIIGL